VALERGAHPFFIAKTAAGDAVDALLGFFQQAFERSFANSCPRVRRADRYSAVRR
jgi:hypothetical protein